LSRDPAADDSLMNLYSAFENNPARYRDPSGEFIVVPLIGFALGGIIDFGIQLIQTRGFTTGNYDPVRGFLAGSAGAIGGAFGAYAMGLGYGGTATALTIAAGDALIGTGQEALQSHLDGRSFSGGQTGVNFAVEFAISLISDKLADGVSALWKNYRRQGVSSADLIAEGIPAGRLFEDWEGLTEELYYRGKSKNIIAHPVRGDQMLITGDQTANQYLKGMNAGAAYARHPKNLDIGYMVLNDNPTLYAVAHERFHFRDHVKYGTNKYTNPILIKGVEEQYKDPLTRAIKEQSVFNQLSGDSHLWNGLLNENERKHAKKYINDLGGISSEASEGFFGNPFEDLRTQKLLLDFIRDKKKK
jgi:hypothetical protein